MTLLWFSGAESGSTVAENIDVLSSPAIASFKVRTGAYSYDIGQVGNYLQKNFTGALGTTYFLTFYINQGVNPTATSTICSFRTSVASIIEIRETTGGKLQLYDAVNGAQVGSDSNETLKNFDNTDFVKIDLAVRISGGSNDDYACLLVNKVVVAASSSLNLGTTALASVRLGTLTGGLARNFIYDDIALCDSNGTDNNTWFGGIGVVLSVPSSDNANAPLWTNGIPDVVGVIGATHWAGSVGAVGGASLSLINVAAYANSLMFVGVTNHLSGATGTLPSVSGMGLTWTQINTVLYSTGNERRITLFYALNTAGEVSGQSISISFGGVGQSASLAEYWDMVNIDQTSPIVQSATNSTASATSITATLAAFADSKNATVGFGGCSSNTSMVVGAGFATVNGTSNANNIGHILEWKTANDTGVDATITGAQALAMIGVEVKFAYTHLYLAVRNTPPIGTASETVFTQIEHAGNSAGSTDAYDANLESYTQAGVPSNAVVKGVQLVAAHGEDITTGAKLLAFSVLSNPAISSSGNVTVGDATPSALGTYPTEWGVHYGTLTENPSVVLGTQPVMRALRPETASRVASVCLMGLQILFEKKSLPPFRRYTLYSWTKRI